MEEGWYKANTLHTVSITSRRVNKLLEILGFNRFRVMTEDTQLIYLLQFDIKSPSVISLPTRSSTPKPPISSITWRWGSSCRVFCSCVLPLEHMLHKSDFSHHWKCMIYFDKKNKAINHEEESRLLHLFSKSIIHFDRCHKQSVFILAALWQHAANIPLKTDVRCLYILQPMNCVLCMI